MAIKKTNYTNGIAFYLTTSTDSYSVLAKKLQVILHQLDNDADITTRRVKDFAHGTLPHGKELDAICLLEDKSTKQWRDIFFPSQQYTLDFLKWNTLTQVKDALKDTSSIDTLIKQRNLSTLYEGMTDPRVTLNKLATILIAISYYKLRTMDLISTKTKQDYSFNQYQDQIKPFLEQNLNSLQPDCVFIQNATQSLKAILSKNKANRANIRREGLIQAIKITSFMTIAGKRHNH